MKKILWLPSWYPTKADPYKGDFIQRQAKAAALYHYIHVIYVEKIIAVPAIDAVKAERFAEGNLTEEIIYNYSSSLPVLGKLFSLLRYYRLNKKYIQLYMAKNGKPDCVHVQVPVKAGIIALWLKRKFKIPYVLTEHYGIYNREVVDPYEDRSFFFKYFSKRVIEGAAIFLPVSRSIGEAINRMVTRKTFTTVPNTVDTAFFKYTPPPKNKFRFIHVSNMIPLKNVEGIVEASTELWKRRQDFELLIVGPVSLPVHEKLQQSGLLNQVFYTTGEVSYGQVAQYMSASHVLVLFSRTENMPCVVLEAFCSGRPVIATSVGGVPEVVNDSNGVLIQSGDTGRLAKAMDIIIDNYAVYSLTAIEKEAAALYSYKATGSSINEVYNRVTTALPR